MKLISVIVPVYKTEKYLRDCVDSILSSTYSALEIILVDDGSPDGCPQICDEYARRDSRIKVIHQENRGVCAARNSGMSVSNGEYIAFVDSDDMVSPLLYEHMVSLLETDDADWAACEATRKKQGLLQDGSCLRCSCGVLVGLEEQLSALTCAPSMHMKTWTSEYVWNKLYRKCKIVDYFRDGCYNVEDLQFNWCYMKQCSKMVYTTKQLYFYRINEDSITETYKSNKTDKIAERGMSISNIYREIEENVPEDYPELKNYLISRVVYVMHGALARIYVFCSIKEYEDFCREAGKYIRKHWKTVWCDKKTYNSRVRLAIVLFVCVYPLWMVATKFLNKHL